MRCERWESCRITGREGNGMMGMMKGCKFDVLTYYRSLGGGQDRWFNENIYRLRPFTSTNLRVRVASPVAMQTLALRHLKGGKLRSSVPCRKDRCLASSLAHSLSSIHLDRLRHKGA